MVTIFDASNKVAKQSTNGFFRMIDGQPCFYDYKAKSNIQPSPKMCEDYHFTVGQPIPMDNGGFAYVLCPMAGYSITIDKGAKAAKVGTKASQPSPFIASLLSLLSDADAAKAIISSLGIVADADAAKAKAAKADADAKAKAEKAAKAKADADAAKAKADAAKADFIAIVADAAKKADDNVILMALGLGAKAKADADAAKAKADASQPSQPDADADASQPSQPSQPSRKGQPSRK